MKASSNPLYLKDIKPDFILENNFFLLLISKRTQAHTLAFAKVRNPNSKGATIGQNPTNFVNLRAHL